MTADGKGMEGDGSSDENAVVLPAQAESTKFEALIEFFHPRYKYVN